MGASSWRGQKCIADRGDELNCVFNSVEFGFDMHACAGYVNYVDLHMNAHGDATKPSRQWLVASVDSSAVEISTPPTSHFKALLECNGTSESRHFKVEISAQTFTSSDYAQGVNSFTTAAAGCMQSEIYVQDPRPLRNKIRAATQGTNSSCNPLLQNSFVHWKRHWQGVNSRIGQYGPDSKNKLPLSQVNSPSGHVKIKKCAILTIKPTACNLNADTHG